MNHIELHFFWVAVFNICKGIVYLLFASAWIKYLQILAGI